MILIRVKVLWVFFISKVAEVSTFLTYISAIHHCVDAFSAAGWNSEIPISVIVGVIANGPINLITIPIRPVNPITTWNREATIIAPCTYNMK